MLTKSDIVKKFNKTQLFALCDELGIKVGDGDHSYLLIDKLTEDLDQNGPPEVGQEVSKTLTELLITLGYWARDHDGGLVIVNLVEKVAENTVQKMDKPLEKPTCFGAADPVRDPGCATCSFKDECWAKRQELRATIQCFGKLYSALDESCKDCLESIDCKELTAQGEG